MTDIAEILTSGLTSLGLRADAHTVPRLEEYARLLDERGRVMNLTAISGREEVARLHFLDSAAVLTLADFKNRSVIDVGTGAGFPGLPMKICESSISLTLLDSLGKRVEFLSGVCRSLGLDDVCCLNARAEEAATGKLRESFDFAVSRAVARLNALCELCLPFVKPGGLFIAMKGAEAENEAAEAKRAIAQLGGALESVAEYVVPGTELIHRAVIIRKESPTPEKYPRRYARIKKSPL